MHNLKRLLPVLVAFFLVGAFAAYANGQGESHKLSGSIVSISNPTPNGQVNVVLSADGKNYTITVNQKLIESVGLTPGTPMNVTGVLHSSTDGTEKVDASEVEVDGKKYVVSQSPAGTNGNAPSVAEDGVNHSKDPSAESEKPDNSPDKTASSTDTETPDNSSTSKT